MADQNSSSLSSQPSPPLRNHAQILSSPSVSFSHTTNDRDRSDHIELTAPIADIDDCEDEVKVKLLKNSENITTDSTVLYIPESMPDNYLGGSTSRNSNEEAVIESNSTPIRVNGNSVSNGNIFILSLNQKLNGARQWWNGTPTANGTTMKKPKNVELLWRNLSYDVAQFKWNKFAKRPCSVSGAYEHRRLLDSISGSIRSGELIAIMGPSGAGKFGVKLFYR